MGIFKNLLKRGGLARKIAETAAETVLPPKIIAAIELADDLGIDDAIGRKLKGKKRK